MNRVLCFGDSNTWGYNPTSGERFPSTVRWTGRLQKKLADDHVEILEEGLCGRTTIFEDETRPGRKGVESLPEVFAQHEAIDSVVLMLGTNDCKTYNHSSAQEIAQGINACLDLILQHVSAEHVLLIAPIHLGEEVWRAEFDPEFNRHSVTISKGLKQEYEKIANLRGVHFVSAADFAKPSPADQEHLNEQGHKTLAEVIYKQLQKIKLQCA